MLHTMRLRKGPFEKIRKGEKTIEIRVNDEKRRALRVGDEIEFRLEEDETKTFRTRIAEFSVFPSFKALCAAFPPHEYGSESADEYQALLNDIYPEEEERRFGVIAIRIERII